MAGRASSDLTAYARSLVDESPARVESQVRDAAVSVVSAWSGVAAENAAQLYEAERPKPGAVARLAAPSIGDRLVSDLGFALAPILNPDKHDSPVTAFLSRLAGVAQLHVAAGDRATMLLSAAADKSSAGVRRWARPGACAFCAYLSSVEATVYDDTHWHNDCTCVNVPWWEDNPLPDADYMDEFSDAAGRAREAILADYMAKRELAPDLRRGNFYRMFPETALNTKNILSRMRADLNLAH